MSPDVLTPATSLAAAGERLPYVAVIPTGDPLPARNTSSLIAACSGEPALNPAPPYSLIPAVDVACGITTVAILNQPDSPSVKVVDVTAPMVLANCFLSGISPPFWDFCRAPAARFIGSPKPTFWRNSGLFGMSAPF